jgi:tRNA threonylcarbamoyl adenosine modification protein YeaZ
LGDIIQKKKVKKNGENIILAIETAICGGSISLLLDGKESDGWIGSDTVSRSEDILPAIDQMLKKNSIDRQQIDRIVFSEEPGSFTGLRIGLATMAGMKNVLRAEFTSVSALEAMIFTFTDSKKESVVALPVGRNIVSWLHLESEGNKVLYQDKSDIFIEFVKNHKSAQFVIHHKIKPYFENSGIEKVSDAGENTAYSLGLFTYQNASDNVLKV